MPLIITFRDMNLYMYDNTVSLFILITFNTLSKSTHSSYLGYVLILMTINMEYECMYMYIYIYNTYDKQFINRVDCLEKQLYG
jgi:hypothetical protein